MYAISFYQTGSGSSGGGGSLVLTTTTENNSICFYIAQLSLRVYVLGGTFNKQVIYINRFVKDIDTNPYANFNDGLATTMLN